MDDYPTILRRLSEQLLMNAKDGEKEF